ncbi:MAG: NUDIX hydrolase, partial [Corynebacterium urealyticum]
QAAAVAETQPRGKPYQEGTKHRPAKYYRFVPESDRAEL